MTYILSVFKDENQTMVPVHRESFKDFNSAIKASKDFNNKMVDIVDENGNEIYFKESNGEVLYNNNKQ